jgi:Rrf2 family transcriptional regulator, iron-sulfur cluster assembly transcription factor
MKITTKGRYGVRAVLYLASTYYNRPVSIKTIAEEEDVSPEFLEQIFFKLKKKGIISSMRGPGGGFVLNRDVSEITILDILRALGESTTLVPCVEKKENCKRSPKCIAHGLWKELSSVIEEHLGALSLKKILDENGRKYYKAINSNQDFII